LLSLCFICKGLVAIKVCILNLFANFKESLQASISFLVARERPAGIDFFKTLLISVTASKSPGDAIGKPASIRQYLIRQNIWLFEFFLLNSLSRPEIAHHHALLCRKL